MTGGDLQVSDEILIPAAEIRVSAIRSQGPGGQNVNKVASAIQLQFDAGRSQVLSEEFKVRLAGLGDRRVSRSGVITIKAQRTRSRERNLDDARERLRRLLQRAATQPKKRVATRPGRKARQKRLDDKAHRARVKRLRGKPAD